MGLAIPLGHFSFELDAGLPIRVRFAPELDDRPDGWRFALLRAAEEHPVAVAIRPSLATTAAPVTIRGARGVPLVGPLDPR
jgi:hypothetical protein